MSNLLLRARDANNFTASYVATAVPIVFLIMCYFFVPFDSEVALVEAGSAAEVEL